MAYQQINMKYEFVKFGYSTIGMSDHGIHNNNNIYICIHFVKAIVVPRPLELVDPTSGMPQSCNQATNILQWKRLYISSIVSTNNDVASKRQNIKLSRHFCPLGLIHHHTYYKKEWNFHSSCVAIKFKIYVNQIHGFHSSSKKERLQQKFAHDSAVLSPPSCYEQLYFFICSILLFDPP